MLRRILALSAATGFVVALSVLGAPGVVAQPTPEATAAVVRGGHFSPDTPAVDVYLTSFEGGTTTLFLSDVGYGDVSEYQRLSPGLYAVGMRPAGADPSTPVVLSWTLDAKAGDAFTACAVGMNNALQGVVLSDDLTAPTQGQARVRVIQAASNAATVDVVAKNGPVLATAAPFAASTNYTELPAGTWPVTARSVDNPSVTAEVSVPLAARSVTTMVVLDKPGGGISLDAVNDASGTAETPTGPVAAGGGATATGGADFGKWLALAATAAAATALALVARSRRVAAG